MGSPENNQPDSERKEDLDSITIKQLLEQTEHNHTHLKEAIKEELHKLELNKAFLQGELNGAFRLVTFTRGDIARAEYLLKSQGETFEPEDR